MFRPISSLVCALLIVGCSPADEPVPDRGAVVDWDAKFRAAEGIRDVGVMSDALAGVAELAAGLGEVDVVKKALGRIRHIDVHDQSARKCAVALAAVGQVESARHIAGNIRNERIRDDALRQIAQSK